MTINSLDPMVGWYDRMLISPHRDILTGLIRLFSTTHRGEKFVDMNAYKQHCIEYGYGSKQTMDELFPIE